MLVTKADIVGALESILVQRGGPFPVGAHYMPHTTAGGLIWQKLREAKEAAAAAADDPIDAIEE